MTLQAKEFSLAVPIVQIHLQSAKEGTSNVGWLVCKRTHHLGHNGQDSPLSLLLSMACLFCSVCSFDNPYCEAR